MNRYILIGNGINIQYGGYNTYSLSAIVKRLIVNLKSNKYETPIFDNSLTGENFLLLFNALLSFSNDIIAKDKEYYENFIENNEEIEAFEQIKSNHNNKISDISDLGFEDWFFVLRLILKQRNKAEGKTHFDESLFETINEGFRRCLLDCIYCEGKIQQIYKTMPHGFKDYLCSFDDIFTVNYDNNIEMLIDKPIKFLHGNFNTFADPLPNKIASGFEHCHCNAVMHYSGLRKNFQMSVDKPKWDCFDKFKQIKGDLTILGMSPDNDSHIFNAIKDNSSILKITYYVANNEQKSKFEDKFKGYEYETKNVFDLWHSF